jgi:fructosamine-3-kinase
MHRQTSKNGKYGWDIDNTIGATPQPNGWRDSWVEFYDEMRLGHMLKLCRNEGADFANQDALRQKVCGRATCGVEVTCMHAWSFKECDHTHPFA